MSEFRRLSTTEHSRVTLIITMIIALWANAVTAGHQKRVLLISSYHPAFPTFFQQVDGMRSVFDPLFVDLDIEFMDSKRFYTPENLNNFYNSLRYKLSRTEDYDVVMAADDNALSFVLEHEQELFDKTPIVFFGVNSIEKAVEQNSNPHVTGLVEAVSMRETIELMIKLHPNIDKIVALVDSTPSGRGDLHTFYALQPAFKSVVLSEISLARCTFEEFAVRLRKIDDKSAVLLLSAYRDKTGRSMAFHQSLELILSNLSRPVYHLWDHGMGDGLLGGKIISHYHQGKKAAELVTEILGGKDPKNIPVVTESPNHYVFDYDALKRFNVKFSVLPLEKTIINLPSTFYTRHKSVIWIGFGVLIGFFAIVVVLSINILRRKRAERDLQKAHDELEKKVRDRTVDLKAANTDLQNEIQERKQVQEALRKSEEKYRSLVETISDWIWEVDNRGVYTYSSPKVSDLLGYPPEDILGKTPYDFMPPEEAKRVGRLFEAVVAAGGPFHGFENSNIHKDGHFVVLETSGVPIFDADGNLKGYRGVDRDITERVQFEAQLRHQAQIIRQVHDSVISTDMEGIITSWNKGSELLFHYSADEVLGNHVALIYPEKSRDMLRDDIIPTLQSRGSHGYETTLIKKGGEEFTGLVSLSLLTNENGEHTGMIGYTLDISEQKRTQQALADSERRLADIIEFLPDPTWVIDLDGRVIAWNRAIERLTGVSKEEILGKGDHSYALPLYNKPRPMLIDLALRRDAHWEKQYLSFMDQDGLLVASESYHPLLGEEGRYLAGTAGRLYNANGDVVGAIESLRDITDAKRLEQEREQLITKLKEALAKVKTLSGLLPICSSCKKIRDDTGYWNKIETYISRHSKAEFSHSICPECAKKLYSDLKNRLDKHN